MLVLRRVAKVDGKSDLATRREVVGWDQCWKSGPCFIANRGSLDKAISEVCVRIVRARDVFEHKNIWFLRVVFVLYVFFLETVLSFGCKSIEYSANRKQIHLFYLITSWTASYSWIYSLRGLYFSLPHFCFQTMNEVIKLQSSGMLIVLPQRT